MKNGDMSGDCCSNPGGKEWDLNQHDCAKNGEVERDASNVKKL